MANKAPNTRRNPVQARSRQTVTHILDAAAQVFSKVGYADATTTRVAERAGVSVGSLYQYFPNKDALLLALGRRHIDAAHLKLAETLTQLEASSPPICHIVQTLVDAMVDVHLDEPEVHRVLFEECANKSLVSDLKQQSEKALIERLVRLLCNHSEVEVSDPVLAASMFAQATESLCHAFVLHELSTVAPRDRFTAEVTAMMTAYLRGHGSQR